MMLENDINDCTCKVGNNASPPDAGWRGEMLRDGVKVALVGPPNAGKSTLLNRLAGRYVQAIFDKLHGLGRRYL